MIIENSYGTVNYTIDFKKYKKIGLSFSGGCDSTLLFYYTLKMFRELKPDAMIIPITGINLDKGLWKKYRSQKILDILLEEFKDIKHQITERYIDYNWEQREYGDFVKVLLREKIIDIRLFALTANPPYDVMEKHDLLRKREISRDGPPAEDMPDFRITDSGPVYDVFRRIDKRWIAEEYYLNNLMENIYPLTASCERLRNTPNMLNNEQPCKHCWWCREKKMAFGTYDGGVI